MMQTLWHDADRFNGKIKYIRDFFITLFFAALGMQDQDLLTLSVLLDSFHMDLSVDVGGQSNRIRQVLHDVKLHQCVLCFYMHVCLWLERAVLCICIVVCKIMSFL